MLSEILVSHHGAKSKAPLKVPLKAFIISIGINFSDRSKAPLTAPQKSSIIPRGINFSASPDVISSSLVTSEIIFAFLYQTDPSLCSEINIVYYIINI